MLRSFKMEETGEKAHEFLEGFRDTLKSIMQGTFFDGWDWVEKNQLENFTKLGSFSTFLGKLLLSF